jgi:hypothetical protein
MTKSNDSEKSKGVVVFAFNTDQVDYVKIADQTSRLIKRHLKLPVTIITDPAADPKFAYDRVIRIASTEGNTRTLHGKTMEWRNFGRYTAYELSPYDQTILLDTDYMVLDNSLLKLFAGDMDYQLMHASHNPDRTIDTSMGPMSLDFVWATVVVFRKSSYTEQFFNLVGRIQQNYGYYKNLFNASGNYRNDYAFAMANIIQNGYTANTEHGIPWSMLTIENIIADIELKDNFLVVKEDTRAHVIARQNMHIMDKDFLVSDKFERLVDALVS